jgi:hypothetical protein
MEATNLLAKMFLVVIGNHIQPKRQGNAQVMHLVMLDVPRIQDIVSVHLFRTPTVLQVVLQLVQADHILHLRVLVVPKRTTAPLSSVRTNQTRLLVVHQSVTLTQVNHPSLNIVLVAKF